MATWKNTNSAIKRLVLSTYRCTVVAVANAQASATHKLTPTFGRCLLRFSQNVQEEVVWVWGLTWSDLECTIHPLWVSEMLRRGDAYHCPVIFHGHWGLDDIRQGKHSVHPGVRAVRVGMQSRSSQTRLLRAIKCVSVSLCKYSCQNVNLNQIRRK